MKASYEYRFRVPFGDVDMMGHVNNAKYLTYFETARTDTLTSLFGNFATGDTGLIIARAEIDYKSPARWNDELIVKVRPVSIGNSSFVYEYEITNVKEQKLVATGKSVQVAYDYAKGVSIPIPEKARTLLLKEIETTKD
ncbi:MAG: acyl-CoA thioesterase [Nitrososphaerales archaeon]